MISYYITMVIGVVIGYFLACLMMVAKGNTQADIDLECDSFYNKPYSKKEIQMWENNLKKNGKII